jgi:hypothetical protein
MRDGHWLLVELYDTQTAELYGLEADIGEGRNVEPASG